MLPSPTMSKALTTDTPPASYSNSSSESGFCFAGATCAAVCLVDRNGANSREMYFYHLGKKSGWCS